MTEAALILVGMFCGGVLVALTGLILIAVNDVPEPEPFNDPTGSPEDAARNAGV